MTASFKDAVLVHAASTAVPGIDVVLSSDMHEETRECVVTSTGALVSEVGQDGTRVGVLDLALGPVTLTEVGLRLDWAEDVHAILIVTLLVLVPLHVGAALKHHFWDRDDVVTGILPEIRDDETAPDHRQYTPRVG